jgi:hypothetical protein
MDDSEREQIGHDRKEALAFTSQMSRWVFSSLLLVNGAALLGLLNAADRLPRGALISAHSFAVGLVSALGAGGLAGFAASAATTRFYFEIRENKSITTFAFATQLFMGAGALLFAMTSIVAFALGVLQLADGLKA